MKDLERGIELCPVDCKYCNPPENHPYTKGHVCELFNEIIRHGSFHPRLIRCETCLYIAKAITSKLAVDEGKVRSVIHIWLKDREGKEHIAQVLASSNIITIKEAGDEKI